MNEDNCAGQEGSGRQDRTASALGWSRLKPSADKRKPTNSMTDIQSKPLPIQREVVTSEHFKYPGQEVIV